MCKNTLPARQTVTVFAKFQLKGNEPRAYVMADSPEVLLKFLGATLVGEIEYHAYPPASERDENEQAGNSDIDFSTTAYATLTLKDGSHELMCGRIPENASERQEWDMCALCSYLLSIGVPDPVEDSEIVVA